MLGTVPVYDAVARYGKDVAAISVDDFFEVVRLHAEDGIDFMTIHAGLTRTAVERCAPPRGSPTWSAGAARSCSTG